MVKWTFGNEKKVVATWECDGMRYGATFSQEDIADLLELIQRERLCFKRREPVCTA